MIPVSRPHFAADEEAAVVAALRSGWVTQGPRVAEFERAFAAALGQPEAIAVSSCTAGLHLVLHALGIGRGDEVVVPSLSFIATANAVAHTGGTPVFADIDLATYNLDAASAARAISRSMTTRAPTHSRDRASAASASLSAMGWLSWTKYRSMR